MDNAQYILGMDYITKEYSGNQVLKGVNLYVKPGKIHALMGGNGAEKSTLMNISSGIPVVHSTGGFDGLVKMAGQPVNIDIPLKAMELGIRMIHQEFMLIPGFTVTEDIKIGREISTPSLVSHIFGKPMESLDAETMARDVEKVLKAIGLQIKDYIKVAGLPVGYMQFIEIVREIDKTGIRLLVFGEPTAVLTESEADRLLEAMRVIASQGIAIIFITHRLGEVMTVADGMTILRDDEFAARRKIKDTSVVEVAKLMIGRKAKKLVSISGEDRHTIDDTNTTVSMKDYYVDMLGEQVEGINLGIRKEETFGIGGLAGQGKLGIPNDIMGLYRIGGQVMINGEPLNLGKLGCALEHKIIFVSEDRKGVGLLLDEDIEHNTISLTMQTNNKFLKRVLWMRFFDGETARERAQDVIRYLGIRRTGTRQVVGSFSGGNQQKVCLARVSALEPGILLVSESTRGIDIGAKKLVLKYLSKLNRGQGTTVIIVPSELVKPHSISDRAVIISDGKLSRVSSPDTPDTESGLAMSGTKARGREDHG